MIALCEWWQEQARLEAPLAAVVPYRNVGVAVHRGEVAVHGANRYLELVGQLLGRHPAARLEQKKNSDQPAGAHARSVADSRTEFLTDTVRFDP